MDIFKDKELSSWLEGIISKIDTDEVESLSFVATGREGTMSAYFRCTPNDLFVMSGTLIQDAIFKAIEENGEWLREVIKPEEDDG